MVDVGALAGTVEYQRCRAISPVHRNGVGVWIWVGQRQGLTEILPLRTGAIGTRFKPGRIIDWCQSDVGLRNLCRQHQPITAPPAESVRTEIIRITQVSQIPVGELGKRNLISYTDRGTAQQQLAVIRQYSDFDEGQALTVRIIKVINKQLVAEYQELILETVHAAIGDLRRRIAIELVEDPVATSVTTVAAGEGTPGYNKPSSRKCRECRLMLSRAELRVDLELTVKTVTTGIVLLAEDPNTTAITPAIVRPGDHISAGIQCYQGGVLLT